MKAVIYARVSYDDRSQTGGRNLQGQIEDARAYCQEKGYRIISELAEDDRGASGASWDLPKLNEALDLARQGEFDILVTRELDRFARSLAKQLVIESEFKRHGVEIEYILGEYPDTPEGNLNKNIKAVVAEYERLKIKERMVRGRRNAAKRGKVLLHGTRAPYGYRLENGGLIVHEEEAKIVKLIFTWYTVGLDGKRLAQRSIAKRLTKMGVATWVDTTESPLKKFKDYGEWSHTTIGNILKNQSYIGHWHYGDIEVSVPPIISEETWAIAQDRKRRNREEASRRTQNEYLLRRRVVCGHCNGRMRARTVVQRSGRAYSYYYCPKGDNVNFRADFVDPIALKWLMEVLEDEEYLGQKIEELKADHEKVIAPLKDRQSIIDNLLTEYGAQLSRLLDLYLGGEFDKEMLTERKARLETTIAGLESERAKVSLRLDVQLPPELVDVLDVAKLVKSRLSEAHDFKGKLHAVETLDAQAMLFTEGSEQFVRLWCAFKGPEDLSIRDNGIGTLERAIGHWS